MDGAKFAKMLSDKHLFELDRMEYKYSVSSVKEFIGLLRQNLAQPLPLADFSSDELFYLPNLAQISTNGMKQLLSVPASNQSFGLQAMTEEIHATFQIESIRSSRNSIRHILNGYAPRNEEESRIYGMKRGLDFIADRQNAITEENLHQLYQISSGDYLPDEDRLLPDHFYRHDHVYVVGGEESREGLPAQQLPDAMKRLVDFTNAKDGINELHKAAILHFAFAYYHPYFDGNGRTARLLHLWYLVQQGYPAALFTPFSRYIAESKAAYYKAYDRVEKNALISGYTDVTPFLSYFCNEIYNRLQVDAAPPQADLQVYQTALANGKITEKERLLWEYVLSAYGTEEFTTKQLEKDFRNAAYATIRTFVMKFHEMGLLAARKAGNRVYYKVR
ncbi:MAG: Fic family protein [Faecalibacterium sp.]|jgi:Fic family protein